MAIHANVFLLKSLAKDVEATHAELFHPNLLTLREHLALPRNGVTTNLDAIMEQMQKGSRADYAGLGLPLIDIKIFEARAAILDNEEVADIADKKSPVMAEVDWASLYCTSPMVTYAFKTWVISMERSGAYRGLVPLTSPVALASQVLFGRKTGEYHHTVHCIEIGAQIGKSPMYVNSALWVLGQRMK